MIICCFTVLKFLARISSNVTSGDFQPRNNVLHFNTSVSPSVKCVLRDSCVTLHAPGCVMQQLSHLF